MKKLAAFAVLALPLCAPASAEDVSGDDECAYITQFEGPGSTTLIFSQSQAQFDNGDEVMVLVTNDIWSLKQGDKIGEIKFDGPDAWFSAEALAIENGFGFEIAWKYFYDVFDESSGGVSIMRNGKEIDALQLRAMAFDVVSFNSCHSKRVAEKAERERKQEIERRWNKDPFDDQ